MDSVDQAGEHSRGVILIRQANTRRSGCVNMSIPNAYLAKLILTRQHDDPVLLIPAGIESDAVQGKVRIGNLLSGVLISIAVLVFHDSFSTLYRSFHNFKRFFSFMNSI